MPNHSLTINLQQLTIEVLLQYAQVVVGFASIVNHLEIASSMPDEFKSQSDRKEEKKLLAEKSEAQFLSSKSDA